MQFLRATALAAFVLYGMAASAFAQPSAEHLRSNAGSDIACQLTEARDATEPITPIFVTMLSGRDLLALIRAQLAHRHAGTPHELTWAGLRFGVDPTGQLTGIKVQRTNKWEPLKEPQRYSLAVPEALTTIDSPYPIMATWQWKSVDVNVNN